MNIQSPTTRQVLNSLDDTVGSFVGQFRKGSIWRELPSEVVDMTVEDALQYSDKVKKLLVDGRVQEMSETAWYSASLVLAIVNERGGLWRRVLSVRLIRASSFEEAFARALVLGRAAEETYVNADGEAVRWRFEKVETLDLLGDGLEDGREVHSEPRAEDPQSAMSFHDDLHPEASYPDQSGV